MDSALRFPTGIPGLDEILSGGFLPASSYLIVGRPGVGKTIFGLQFLRASVRRSLRCLYVTCAEPEVSLRRTAASLHWDLEGVTIADMSQKLHAHGITDEYTVFSPAEAEAVPVWEHLRRLLEEHRPQCLVLDSLTVFRFLALDAHQYRRQLQALVNYLSSLNCVSLLLYDPEEIEHDSAPALAVDGVITLHNEVSPNKLVEIRTLEVNKLRASDFLSGRHAFRITPAGIQVWPHRVERLKRYAYDRTLLSSGIAALDEMLAGGVPSGTCTLVSGPAGVGKSTLAMSYLVQAARNGQRSVVYSFEEGAASMIERCRGIRLPLEQYMEEGFILVREVNPLEHYPDEFMEMMRQDLERDGRTVFVMDSLRGFHLAMQEFGDMLSAMQNIINYVRRNRASLFLINEQEKITGDLQVTDMGVSYAADNVLLIRYAEVCGRVIRLISCLKKRIGPFDSELREFQITPDGIQVGGRLTRFQGVLAGMPALVGGEDEPSR